MKPECVTFFLFVCFIIENALPTSELWFFRKHLRLQGG